MPPSGIGKRVTTTDWHSIFSTLSQCVSRLTLWAHDGGAALVVPVLDDAVLADGLDEGADVEVAHEHLVVARAVQARLVCHDLFALRVVLELVIATCKASIFLSFGSHQHDVNTVLNNSNKA